MYEFYDYCNLLKEIVSKFGNKEFTNKDCKEHLYSCLALKKKMKELISAEVIIKRVENFEIEVLPNVKIKAEKFYYSINVDKMMVFLEVMKKRALRKNNYNYDMREYKEKVLLNKLSQDYRYKCNFIETENACWLEKICDYMYKNNIETLSKKEVLDLYDNGKIKEEVAVAVLQKFRRKKDEKGFILRITPERIKERVAEAIDFIRINKESKEENAKYLERYYKEVVEVLRNGL